jgi:MFS family permease
MRVYSSGTEEDHPSDRSSSRCYRGSTVLRQLDGSNELERRCHCRVCKHIPSDSPELTSHSMTKELKLTRLMGTVSLYSVVTVVFFATYIVFQPPATIIVRKLGPRNFLSIIVIAWGAVMIGMGFVKNFESLAALRVVLGILEAGFFPSCVYLLSTWYTRFDVGKRYSCFYILGSLASACAGILAYGLMQLNGRQGLTGYVVVLTEDFVFHANHPFA